MAFAIAGLRATDEIVVEGCNNVATSFPNFIDAASAIGLDISVETNHD
jgi:3-phosphoshikimate 1-carboxyvinyltransferase